jgi:hypothetical protein
MKRTLLPDNLAINMLSADSNLRRDITYKLRSIDKRMKKMQEHDIFAVFDVFQICNSISAYSLPRDIKQMIIDIACTTPCVAEEPRCVYTTVLMRTYSFATNRICRGCKRSQAIYIKGDEHYHCECGALNNICKCGHNIEPSVRCKRMFFEDDEINDRCRWEMCSKCIRHDIPPHLIACINGVAGAANRAYINIKDCHIDVEIDAETKTPFILCCNGCFSRLKNTI